MSILKVYSIHYILRYNTNVKKFPSDNINGTKNILFFLSRTTTHHSFTFNLRFLYELSRRFVSLKLCAEFTIFDSVSFLCLFMSILKVYSIHYILRYNTNVKKFPSDNINGTKNILFFLSRTTTHHSFTFNLRFLYELSRRFVSLKLCAEFTIFDSVSFLLKFMFLFNKMHGLFDFKTS